MHTFYLILLSVSFQIPQISCANDKPESSTGPISILPLVVEVQTLIVVKPTKLQTVSWLEKDKIFNGATSFSPNPNLGGKIQFLCAKADDSEDADIDTTNVAYNNERYCSYPTAFRAFEALQCAHEPEPVAEEVPYLKTACDHNKRSKMYHFYYELCLTNEPIDNEEISRPGFFLTDTHKIVSRKRFLIYQFCFDEDAKETLYTYHDIYSPDLLSDVRLQHERQKTFDIINNKYTVFGTPSETIKQLSTKSRESLEEAQQLVPADDMALALWRKPTYNLLNLKAIKKNLKDFWNHVTELIRLSAIHLDQCRPRYDVHTRTITAAQNQHHQTPGDELQQPDVWLKIISCKSEIRGAGMNAATAIVLNNNSGNQFADELFNNICKENLCEGAFSEKFPDVAESLRCCEVNDYVESHFARRWPYRILNLEFLNFKT